MKKTKIIIIYVFVLLTLLLLSGCKETLLYRELFVRKKDINGSENTSLAIYTEEDVCNPNLNGHGLVYGFGPEGESSFPDEELLWDGDITNASAVTSYSGNATLQLTYGKTDIIKFTVIPTLTKGNLRIVLLDQDYNILYDFATDQESSYEVSEAKGKQFEIRAVCESAKFRITTKREFGA